MTIRETLVEMANEDLLMFMDGYDDCIVGLGERFGGVVAVIYDKSRIIASMIRDGMTYEEAMEYFDFNVIGAWVGEHTPIFLTVSYDLRDEGLRDRDEREE